MTAPSVLNVYALASGSSVTTSPTAAGSLLVAFVNNGSLAGVTAPSVGGTSFAQDVSPFGASASFGGVYSLQPPTGTTTVSFTSGQFAVLYELASGSSWGSSPFDVSHAATGAIGTQPDSGASPSTAQAVEIILGFVREDGGTTYTPGTGYTLDYPPSGSHSQAAESLVTSTAGSQDATFAVATTRAWACCVVAYKPEGIVTSTRQIPDSAALSLTSRRIIPDAAKLVFTGIRSIPSGAALQGSFRRTIPNKAALIETSTRSVPNRAALTHTAVRSVPNRAELIGSIVRSIPNRVALINTVSRSIPNQAELADEHIRQIPNRVFLYTPIPPDGRDMTRPVESPSRRNIWKG